MIYADYKFYSEVYGGKNIAEGDFPRLAARASTLIDKLTFGRAEEHANDERVKMCCCELCESLSALSESGGRIIQSESVGSWSATYANSENTSEMNYARAACRTWLPADWLYRGVARE